MSNLSNVQALAAQVVALTLQIKALESELAPLKAELREARWAKRCLPDELEGVPFSVVMSSDPELAWAWHCNLTMMAVDAGAEHTAANKRAADFMKSAFDVDIRSNPLWSIE